MPSYPVADIDLTALRHNFARVKQYAPNSKIMSVIKANAYGHGDIAVANALSDSDAFAVARLSEAIRLRQAGIKQAIVLLEGVETAEAYQQASEHGLSLVFHHPQQIADFCQLQLAKPLSFCWLMVETGMHRLGLPAEQADAAIDQLKESGNITGDIGLMSHFANADQLADQRNDDQWAIMSGLQNQLSLPISMANSAAILTLPNSHQHWVRPGLMLYGASPVSDQPASEFGLKPVMTVKAQLISIEQLQAGDQVGYGGTWQAKHAMRVGTVNIGYGDGYSRQLSQHGQVSIHGQVVAVLGRVSMDMICIDLSNMKDAQLGDEVILWGDEQVSVESAAEHAGTIAYELLCQLNQRVSRQYHG